MIDIWCLFFNCLDLGLTTLGNHNGPGAPTLASSSGNYVAGNRLKRLASAQALHSQHGGSFDETFIESQWRLDQRNKEELPEPSSEVTPTVPESSEGAAPSGDIEAAAPAESAEPKGVVDVPSETPMECEGHDLEGEGDSIPMGYSPTSAGKSSATPKPIVPRKSVTKFDKYYHQILDCNIC